MRFLDWIKSLFSRPVSSPQIVGARAVEPTHQEMQTAMHRLNELAKTAILGEIGGSKPQKENRATSWWGGNFLGAQDEEVPVCNRSGQMMHPVLQIRVDELPEIPPAFEGLALINIWMDLQSSTFWGAENGNGFLVRTYTDVRNLVPLGGGYRESSDLPTFPVFWRETIAEKPSWEDMAGEVPTNVARASANDWFFSSKHSSDRYHELRSKYPVKIGGWPTWIQGSNWPKDAQFFFQVDSTDKGKMSLGDAGSFYIFKTSDSWVIRGDCY
ncbi:DUF1963 domain-containing protein [Parasulfitobacter algicola]|uniref:DUF1963 domain-containing protein n=1 Tax=Parasulfitobacter algicola TaxID=2614809 RepID=A0ABX2IT35_9RHOB|nr:DUF1963 domain-containing protein [Sulfitobacter algicola]NSX56069.1 DUF1963 domain-containing protein [Sulfitobacter algicola]